MLHEKYAEQNNVTIASNTTFDLQYERTCLRTHTAIDCSFIAGWHLLLPTGAWTKTTTTSFHTHHFVTAVREKSPKFKSFRFIMNPIPEKKKNLQSYPTGSPLLVSDAATWLIYPEISALTPSPVRAAPRCAPAPDW